MAIMLTLAMQRYAEAETSRERLFSLIEQNWERNRGVPIEEIEAEVDDAVRAVRRALSDPSDPLATPS